MHLFVKPHHVPDLVPPIDDKAVLHRRLIGVNALERVPNLHALFVCFQINCISLQQVRLADDQRRIERICFALFVTDRLVFCNVLLFPFFGRHLLDRFALFGHVLYRLSSVKECYSLLNRLCEIHTHTH